MILELSMAQGFYRPMSVEGLWGHFFKPEVLKRGREAFTQGRVTISNGSDTQINAYVKATPPVKVAFRAVNIASQVFTVDCSCPASSKGALCKHIWALLLQVQKTHPDFLDSKKDLEKTNTTSNKSGESPLKAKQAEYKKLQSERQKAWAKKQRLDKKKKTVDEPRERYSEDVEAALEFFAVNGFPLAELQGADHLKKAKKTLATIFHPDRGGSHEEAVILNQHFDILERFFSR